MKRMICGSVILLLFLMIVSCDRKIAFPSAPPSTDPAPSGTTTPTASPPSTPSASSTRTFTVTATHTETGMTTRTFTPTPTDSPTWSPTGSPTATVTPVDPGSDLLYESDQYGNDDIFAMDSSGSNIRRLTSHADDERYPSWSHDKSLIAFSRFNASLNTSFVFFMNPDGSGATQITPDGTKENYCRWAPSDFRIVVVRHTPTYGLYVMNSDRTNETALRAVTTEAYHEPAWTPDGSWVVYSLLQATILNDIYRVKVDDLTVSPIITWANFQHGPRCSPDGLSLVFSSQGADGVTRICVTDIDGNSPVSLTGVYDTISGFCPVWSPNGQWIAYSRGFSISDADIWIMRSDGTNKTPLTSNSYCEKVCDWR